MQDLHHQHAAADLSPAAAAEHRFAELFAPSPPIWGSEFFLSDDQFLAEDVTMSADAINRAFIDALQQFNRRDELTGLRSLCARFGSS
jgi:hypothetical protein